MKKFFLLCIFSLSFTFLFSIEKNEKDLKNIDFIITSILSKAETPSLTEDKEAEEFTDKLDKIRSGEEKISDKIILKKIYSIDVDGDGKKDTDQILEVHVKKIDENSFSMNGNINLKFQNINITDEKDKKFIVKTGNLNYQVIDAVFSISNQKAKNKSGISGYFEYSDETNIIKKCDIKLIGADQDDNYSSKFSGKVKINDAEYDFNYSSTVN